MTIPMKKNTATKTKKILHNGNHSKAVLAKYKNTLCVIKKYYSRNTKEFEREKCILNEISHENIITPVFIGRSRTIALEPVGETLRKYITDGKINRDNAVCFAKQITAALQHIHNCNIIHFDLKPENIIICGNTVKLIDFGSAKFTNEDIEFIDTTVAYTSLEYLLGLKKAYSFKDIWSFGCILYEMITQETIFKTSNAFSLISEILDVFGSPERESFSELDVKHTDFINIYDRKDKNFNLIFGQFSIEITSLFRRIFEMSPLKRISAAELAQELKNSSLFNN